MALRLRVQVPLASRWEDVDPLADKRPARRYYRLTAGGAAQASEAAQASAAPGGRAERSRG
jgi:PadR family transcriptional regulator, regulatory protein PadR